MDGDLVVSGILGFGDDFTEDAFINSDADN